MTANLPRADFLLPGTWWRVSLASTEEINRSARAMAQHLIGRSDEYARLRADLVEELKKAAHAAREASAHDFYFALEIADGVRVPLTMALYWPELPQLPSLDVGGSIAAESLAQSLRGTHSGAEVDVLTEPVAGIVRTVTVEETAAVERFEKAEDAGRIDLSYWIREEGAPRPLLLSFTSPMSGLREPLQLLCDAIAASVTWRAEAATALSPTPEAD